MPQGIPQLTFERVIGEHRLVDHYLFRITRYGFQGFCPRCRRGTVRINNRRQTFRCSRCSAAGGALKLLAIVRRVGIREATRIAKSLGAQETDVVQSAYFRQRGLLVAFRDVTSATVFDQVLRICQKMDVPFDEGYGVLMERWLRHYLGCLHDGSAPPTPPTERDLERWCRSLTIRRR